VGRGDRATRRWKNDRIRKKKARDKRPVESTEAAAPAAKRTA
jgi:hypothetical protein